MSRQLLGIVPIEMTTTTKPQCRNTDHTHSTRHFDLYITNIWVFKMAIIFYASQFIFTNLEIYFNTSSRKNKNVNIYDFSIMNESMIVLSNYIEE